MTWLAALPAGLVAVAWLLGPGLALTYPLGLRGALAWGVAPLASVALIAGSAVVAGATGIPWSPLVPVVAALLSAGIAVVLRRRLPPPSPDGPRLTGAAAAGLSAAVLGGVITAVVGMGRPDALSQTFDAVFHYNAVAYVLAQDNASSLQLGGLAAPDAVFYPGAWHGLVALVVATAGASVPLASNVVAVAVAALVWPLSCLVLVRQVVGRSVAATLVTPVVALGFAAFPWSLMSFGVLWPNLLGLALVPVGLAAAVTLAGLAREGAFGRGHAVVIGAVCVVALGLAHPNSAFSLMVLAAFPAAWWLVGRVRGLTAVGRQVAAAVTAGAAAVVVGAFVWLVAFSPVLSGLRAFDWPAYQSPGQAVREVLTGATNGKEAALALSLVVLGGALVALRTPGARWLVPAHLAGATLFLLASSTDSALTAAVTGVWWNDSHRLAAMLPLTGVPLAVLGLSAAGGWAAVALRRAGPLLRRPGVLTAAAAALLVLVSAGLYTRSHAALLSVHYPATAGNLLTPDQREFVGGLDTQIPQRSVVAQNPWAGAVLLYALTGRQVLFPHLQGSWTDDQLYLAANLRDVATDPLVCRAAQRTGVDHALVGPVVPDPWDERADDYPGLEGLDEAPGFELLASDGDEYALYRITACAGETAAG